MSLPYHRRTRRKFTLWHTLFILAGVIFVVGIFQWWNENGSSLFPTPVTTTPRGLTRADVLPTLTPNPAAPVRSIVFPAAGLTSPIIESIRTANSWETRYLGSSVGHLQGTSWLNGAGGNIVLAGHVEDATGLPGPFAYLFKVKKDDLVILHEGTRGVYYRVVAIERAAPDNMSYVAQDGRPRLTLITCTDWDFKAETYQGRLIVVAEPLMSASVAPTAAP